MVHEPIERSELDPDAVKIIERLTRFGHGAYLVGGCVRDLLLERKPKDFDIGTSATPRQIRRLFRNCRIIGRRFRLAHIYFQNGKIIEVATFRAQNGDEPPGEGADSGEDLLIRDDNQFGTMEQDALRRDFTINSLFYDIDQGTVLDHADGLGDLRRRVVRTIGDPTIRFKEDPIRSLRAIKFSARLDFDIEERTLSALRSTRGELPKAATPRILEELNRFCRGGAARRSFELLREHGILEIIAPEIADPLERDPQRWELLCRLLEGFDRRTGAGGEITGGQVVTAIVLASAISLSWAEPLERGVDPLADVDAVLKPLAQRLRLARKDQEQCRLTAATLRRMVPVRSLHRNTKRSVSRSPVAGEAMLVLEGLAGAYGGEFATAASWWREAIGRGGAEPTDRPQPAPDRANEPSSRGAGRKRRRRGGRRRGSDGTAPSTSPRSVAESPRRGTGEDEKRPPVWDDDYFFAALPTAPGGLEAEETEPLGYGAVPGVSVETSPDDSDEDSDAAPAAEASPLPRRRRRRRRGGSRGGRRQDSGSPSDSSGD